MTQHTPGPWTLSGLDIEVGTGTDGWKRVASVSWRKCRPASAKVTGEEGAANARLITAAPEMLALLQDAAKSIEWAAAILQAPDNSNFLDRARDIRALLAKIEGGK